MRRASKVSALPKKLKDKLLKRLDLGGAVKGFKDGMKDGASSDAPTATGPAAQVTSQSAATDKPTIDVEARHKS